MDEETTYPFLLILDRAKGGMRFSYLSIDLHTRSLAPKVNHVTFARLLDITQYAACVFQNQLYVTGGRDRESGRLLSDVMRYRPDLRRWLEVSNMQQKRAAHCTCVTSTGVMVLGGQGRRQEVLDLCEVYEPLTDQWHQVALLPQPRAHLAAVSHRDVIYVSGGVGPRAAVTDGVWAYRKTWADSGKPAEFRYRWTEVVQGDRAPRRLQRHAMTSHRGQLIILGGLCKAPTYDGVTVARDGALAPSLIGQNVNTALISSDQVWVHSLKSDRRRHNHSKRRIPDMPCARTGAAVFPLGNKLYVLGGQLVGATAAITVRDVIYYHTKQDRWVQTFHLPEDIPCDDVTVARLEIPSSNEEFKPVRYSDCKWVLW